MRKKLIAQKIIVAIIGSLLATPSFAGPKERAERREARMAAREARVAAKEESIGLGSGAVIGAAAGGPIGFVLGAAFGGWLGDRFHDERAARRDADERAVQASAHAGSLQTLLAESERVVAEKNAELYSERVAHRRDLQEALSVEVFFRTEESGLGGSTEERLAKLAALIEPMEGAVIRLEGHTDVRGTQTYNSTLSTARAQAVRDALIRGGMPAERVIVTGVGEESSTAPVEDTDGMALERRVEMNVVDIDGAGRVAELGTN
ncbi:MAG TPA: OmpA family protein [Gammaproteobacteria bacterium]|nr:OmpA family protein [Gammaproteobacteria bacterium]